jgi:hypothetical protein
MTLKIKVREAVVMGITLMLVFTGVWVMISDFTQNASADAPFTSSEEVSDDAATEAQADADIAADGSGNLYAVWQDMDNGVDWDIFYANSTDGGQSWRSPTVRINTSSEDQTEPSIAVDPSTSAIYVAWQDKRGGDWNISFANSTDSGTTWSNPPVQINDDVGTERQGTPDITVDSFGAIHAVWEDKRWGDWDIFYSKSTDGGFTWSPNKKVSDTTANQRSPSIAVDSSGNPYAVWHDDRNGATDIYCANSTDGGNNWGSDTKVSDALAGSVQKIPSIAVDNSGTLYAVWGDWRGGVGADIYFSKSTDSGDSWTTNTPVNDETDNNQENPDMVWGAGTLWVVWADNQFGNQDIYFTNSTDGGINWGTDIRVNDQISSVQFAPAIAFSPSTQSTHVVWEDDRDGDVDIYSSSLLPPAEPPTVDRIFISRSSNGDLGEVTDGDYEIGGTDDFYAVGWNDSLNKFVSLVSVTWGVNPLSIGSVNPGTGVNTTFTAIGQGTCKVTAFDPTYGFVETGTLTVTGGAIDSIRISLTPDGISDWIGDQFYTVLDTETFYACGWNDTNDEFVELVDVTWESDNDLVGEVTSPGNSTTFTAVGDGTCTVTATHGLYGTNKTGVLTVTSYTIDRFFVSLSSNGNSGGILDQSFPIGESVTLYAVGWNDTSDEFVKQVDATWASDNTAVGDVVTTFGKSTIFEALSVGTCRVTATNSTYGSNQTGILTVFALEVDQVVVSPNSDGTGGSVGSKTYSVEETDIFYAQGWNSSYNQFLELVDVTWSSTDNTVGSVTPAGYWTNFTAEWVTGDSSCTVSAEYLSITGSTGTLSVLAPKVDWIVIRDEPNDSGNVLETATFDIGDEDTYYAAGYNDTVEYIGDISGAQWSVSGNIGSVNPSQGNSTTFSATDAGSGTISVSFSDITNQSGTITVLDDPGIHVPPIPPETPTLTVKGKDKIEITWSLNPESDIQSYVIHRATDSAGPWTNVTTLSNTTTSYSDSNLEANTKYYYRLVAIDLDGLHSQPSTVVSTTTAKEGNGDGDGDGVPWVLLIILIVIVIVIILLMILLMRRGGAPGGNGRYDM